MLRSLHMQTAFITVSLPVGRYLRLTIAPQHGAAPSVRARNLAAGDCGCACDGPPNDEGAAAAALSPVRLASEPNTTRAGTLPASTSAIALVHLGERPLLNSCGCRRSSR